jgi:hypothetical protein
MPYRAVAANFGISSIGLISTHINRGHIKNFEERCVKAAKRQEAKQDVKDIPEALDLQACAREIYDVALGSAKDARKAGKFSSVGLCLGPATKVLEILAKGEPLPSDVIPPNATEEEIDARLNEYLTIISETSRSEHC